MDNEQKVIYKIDRWTPNEYRVIYDRQMDMHSSAAK